MSRTSSPPIRTMRAYDAEATPGAARLLVDRLWPRGLSRERLHLDEWVKEVAPSNELRQWFHHETPKWTEFVKRYEAELHDNPDAVNRCLDWCRKGPVVLLYGARDEQHNNAAVLQTYLEHRMKGHHP